MNNFSISDLLMKVLNEDSLILVLDRDARVVHFNDKFSELSGYSKEEAVGMPIKKLNSGFHSKEFFAQLWKTVLSGHIWRGEIRNKSKDGRIYWADTVIYPEMDSDGQAKRFLCIRRDITLEKMNENDERFDLSDFVLHMPATIFRIVQALVPEKRELYFKYISPEIERLTGFVPAVFVNQKLESFLRLIKNESRSEVASLFEHHGTGATQDGGCEFFITDRSGEERRLRLQIRAHECCKEKKGLILLDGILFDITKEWKMMESLKVEKLKLAQASRLSLIGELSAGVAHEINNPLAIIFGKLQIVLGLLKNEKIENKKIEEGLVRALEATKRATTIVSNIRSLSRDDSEEEILSVSLSSVLAGTLNYVRARAANHQINIETDDFPDIQFQGREVQASQVFINLLVNAIDAVSLLNEKWIRVKVKSLDDFVEVRFVDSGTGILPDILNKIMDPFFTTKDIGKGTGLGLSISKNIIESFGGRLFYELFESHTSFVVHLSTRAGAVLLPLNVEEAISAHAAWKQRIVNYIKNSERNLVPSEISSDQRCSLGKWIINHEEKYKGNSEFLKLKEIHREFHLVAGDIIAKVNLGEDIRLDAVFSPQGEYSQKSNEIVQALLNLRDSVESVQRAS